MRNSNQDSYKIHSSASSSTFLSPLLPACMLIDWESRLNHAAMSAHDPMYHCHIWQIGCPEYSVRISHHSKMTTSNFSGHARLELGDIHDFTGILRLH